MKKILAFFSILTIGLVAAFGLSSITDLPGPLSLLEDTECQWQNVEINGQTYDSVEELKEDWNRNSDTDFSELEAQFDFRVVDGTLEYQTCSERGVAS